MHPVHMFLSSAMAPGLRGADLGKAAVSAIIKHEYGEVLVKVDSLLRPKRTLFLATAFGDVLRSHSY